MGALLVFWLSNDIPNIFAEPHYSQRVFSSSGGMSQCPSRLLDQWSPGNNREACPNILGMSPFPPVVAAAGSTSRLAVASRT